MAGKLLAILLLISLFTISVASPPRGTLRLIKVAINDEGHWATDAEISALKKNDTGFMDITNVKLPKGLVPRADLIASIPTQLEAEETVRGALELIQGERMHAFLEHFSGYYHNRYYTEVSGRDAAEWLLNEVQNSILANSDYSAQVSARYWKHVNWLQQSVFVRIPGSDPSLAKEVVIIGAHLDSVNKFDNEGGRAPGADDNASGSAVLLETLRIVLENNFVPQRTVEFQWYAAEEDGLLGSTDIANAYYHSDLRVISMVNFDMASYSVGNPEIGLVQDYSNFLLSDYLGYLIGNYTQFTRSVVVCGGRCTDHVPFTEYGFPAASPVNPVPNLDVNTGIHTEHDNMEKVNIPQLVEFTKLGLSYVMEVGKMGSGGTALQLSIGVMATIVISMIYFISSTN